MAGQTNWISKRDIVNTNSRYVVMVEAGGVTSQTSTSITFGVTASAFGDIAGTSGITSGTAKLFKSFSCVGIGSSFQNDAGHTSMWTVSSGTTGTKLSMGMAVNNSLMFIGSGVGNMDLNGEWSIPQPTSEGKVTVSLDNSLDTKVGGNWAYGSIFLEFTI